jgi:hypothetical protein
MTMADLIGADAKAPDGVPPENEAMKLSEEAAIGEPEARSSSEGPVESAGATFDDVAPLPWRKDAKADNKKYKGYNAWHVLSLLILGLLAVALIGGGIWRINNRKDDVLVDNRSVVARLQQPYKERPKNPGSKTFPGPGDTSFAISEGRTGPAKIGPPPAASNRATEAAPKASDSAAPTPSGAGVGVQVAAYSRRAQAEDGWTRLSRQYELLSGLHHRVVEGQADMGTVYRLQATAGDVGAAHALCGKLKAAGLACHVKN